MKPFRQPGSQDFERWLLLVLGIRWWQGWTKPSPTSPIIPMDIRRILTETSKMPAVHRVVGFGGGVRDASTRLGGSQFGWVPKCYFHQRLHAAGDGVRELTTYKWVDRGLHGKEMIL